MCGNRTQEKLLLNLVNRSATQLIYEFYKKHVIAMTET